MDNEINLNFESSCKLSCSDYTLSKHYRCAKDSYCHDLPEIWNETQAICKGAIIDCQSLDDDLRICPAVNHINFDMLKLFICLWISLDSRLVQTI